MVVTPDDQVVELGGAAPHTTNNRMEMLAAIEVLQQVQDLAGTVEIRTDSSYLINGVTKWVHAWRKRGWKTIDGKDVLNRDLWETLVRLTGGRSSAHRVTWQHVRGHAGEAGNERADTIATGFATGAPPLLYAGPLAGYDAGIRAAITAEMTQPPRAAARRAPRRTALAAQPESGSSARPAASHPPLYLSLVGGVLQRHATWAECEARVRHVSGARFKKVKNPDEEAATLREWGLRSGAV